MINGELFCESKSLKEARNKVKALVKINEVENHLDGLVSIERSTQITKRINTFKFEKDKLTNDMF